MHQLPRSHQHVIILILWSSAKLCDRRKLMWCSECQRFSAAFFHISSLKNANTSNDTAASKQPNSFWFWEKSGRWQAPAAVLPPEGPKDKRHGHSRARRAREWPKHASPRARRARGRAKLSAHFGACQCYYMFFTIQPKIAIFMAQFKYLNDGENA